MTIEQMQSEITRLEGEKAILEGKAQNRQQYPATAQREQFAGQAQQLANRIGWLQYNIQRERELNSPMMKMAAQIADQLKAKEEAAAAAKEQARQAGIRQAALSAYLAQGGTVESFEIAWIGIQSDLARDAALNAARQAMQASGNPIVDAARKALMWN